MMYESFIFPVLKPLHCHYMNAASAHETVAALKQYWLCIKEVQNMKKHHEKEVEEEEVWGKTGKEN